MGKLLNDLTDLKFGRLTVKSHVGKGKWECECECGNTKIIPGASLRLGKTKSCGCYRLDKLKEHPSHVTHKLSKSRIYHIYYNMKQRCYNDKTPHFENYGGRGISVCDEWKNSFKAFYDWSMSHGYSDYLTIDRIDNDGNYEPNNCRWVTRCENNKNKKRRGI